MGRWLQKLPERDWGKWGVAYLAHGATGAVASAGSIISIVEGPFLLFLPFLFLSGLVCWRQYVEYLRRNDTPGRDLGDHIVGYGIGIGIGLAWIVISDLTGLNGNELSPTWWLE